MNESNKGSNWKVLVQSKGNWGWGVGNCDDETLGRETIISLDTSGCNRTKMVHSQIANTYYKCGKDTYFGICQAFKNYLY